MKLEQWLDEWINRYVRHRVKRHTLISYTAICRNHILPALGQLELEALDARRLQAFVLEQLERGNLHTGGGLSSSTVNGIISVLRLALREAVALGLTGQECTDRIRLPRQCERESMALERREQQALERFCLRASRPNYIGVVLCLYTGIRLGELLALTWEDIDLTAQMLHINKTVYTVTGGGREEWVVDTPKTRTSRRSIPLPSPLCALLLERYGRSGSPYLIATRNGGMVSPRSYQRTFASILRRAALPPRNFHILRHTFATRALEAGMDVRTLCEILGHRNPTVTLGRYSHSMLQHKSEMMQRVGDLLVDPSTVPK